VTRALRIVHRNALVYRRVWRGSVFTSFLQPTLFLLAMGLGVGGMVDPGGSGLPGGVPFLHFLAPGLLAAACMQTSAAESSWPVAGKMRWQRNYEAMVATPIGVRDLVVGELLWVAARVAVVALAFGIVAIAFGAMRPPVLPPVILAGVLLGVAFSTPILAYAATLPSNGNFNVLFRFVITPLFLFSGVFVPVANLPVVLQGLAWATPLFHGVELVRGAALGTATAAAWLVHVLYLVAMTVIGLVVAERTFRRRLHT
jgi:lipooligosaccharide transport system permease protein